MSSTGRSSSVSMASQPKSIAVAGDGTVFIAEINCVEAFRNNQRVLEHKPSFMTSALAIFEGVVALGGEVHTGIGSSCLDTLLILVLQDQKVRLYSWDGKTLTETAILEGNKGVVSALSFTPDGKLLASGDVSSL